MAGELTLIRLAAAPMESSEAAARARKVAIAGKAAKKQNGQVMVFDREGEKHEQAQQHQKQQLRRGMLGNTR
ncbi:hypothetical protein ANO11243_037670 [Dothideomycetidae sp. 11243]|nr:hypothetical protein ANO11243_037670 [fungal sp. No.11243]